MVDGAAIAYRTWGEPGGRGIVLVHQPIALVAAIRTLLSGWDHSLPATGP
jgi:hypothetical protein